MKPMALAIIALSLLFICSCGIKPVIDGGDLGYKQTIESGKYYPHGESEGSPVVINETKTIQIDVENPNNSEGGEITIGPDGSMSSENQGSFQLDDSMRGVLLWGGIFTCLIGAGCVGLRAVYHMPIPFGVSWGLIGDGLTMVFAEMIVLSWGVPGVLCAVAARTGVSWFVSSTSMGRDARRALEEKVEALA